MGILGINPSMTVFAGSASLPSATGLRGFVHNAGAAVGAFATKVQSLPAFISKPVVNFSLPNFPTYIHREPHLSMGVASGSSVTSPRFGLSEEMVSAIDQFVEENIAPRVNAKASEAGRAIVEAFRPEFAIVYLMQKMIEAGKKKIKGEVESPEKQLIKELEGRPDIKSILKVLAFLTHGLKWPARFRNALIVQYLSTGPSVEVTEYLVEALNSLRGLGKSKELYRIAQIIIREYPRQLRDLPEVVSIAREYEGKEAALKFLESIYPRGGSSFGDRVARVSKQLKEVGWSDKNRRELLWQIVVDMHYTGELRTGVKNLPRSVMLTNVSLLGKVFAELEIDSDKQYQIFMKLLDPDHFEFKTLNVYWDQVKSKRESGLFDEPATRFTMLNKIADEVNAASGERVTRRLSEILDVRITAYPLIDEPPIEIVEKYARKYQDIKDRMDKLGITVLDRLGTTETMNEIIRNRTESGANDTRPVLLMIMAKEDHNGAFRVYNSRNLEGLMERHRVLYYEVNSFQDFSDRFWSGLDEGPDSIIIGGHGSQDAIALERESLVRGIFGGAGVYLSLNNIPSFAKASSLLAGKMMLLVSCSVAKGGEKARNVANTWAETLPQTTIQAMIMPGNADAHEFNDDGSLNNANFSVPSVIINRNEGRYDRVAGKLRSGFGW